jgi:predicted TIM-barrel fold metal-dependent hydrolase
MGAALATDVHQHLWPEQLVDRLRARSRTPYLRGWTLYTRGEPAYDVDPTHHDIDTRIAADLADGVGTACVSLSAPLGIESLVRPEAGALLAAWHAGAAAFPEHFRAWASVPMVDPDLAGLADLLDAGFVGVQLPATDLASPAAWERAGDVLRVAEEAGKPVFVHPGPEVSRSLTGALPEWWAPVVGYTTQMQAAWWGWQAARGRELFPSLRVLFGAGAGLAPVHHERYVARGGESPTIDPQVYVDTSSYGPQALDALVRVLGIDVLALGSDRPYAAPIDRLLGDAATHAIRVANPRRLLDGGDVTQHRLERVEGRTWPRAS